MPSSARLLTSNALFVNESLAKLYGVPGIVGDNMQKVAGESQGASPAFSASLGFSPFLPNPVRATRFIGGSS